MRLISKIRTFTAVLTASIALATVAYAGSGGNNNGSVQLGPRPFYLVSQMSEGDLKARLEQCAARTQKYKHHDFSIGHRGAGLQFPEHTRESYEAARRMGAGILECDVTFTADGELVCRHAQCDLHTTTNILATPLAAQCAVPFTPATFDAGGNRVTPATARCCTSALTLGEFKSLEGNMDARDANATTVE
jgi:glycerophosphoryl diester phosphodiesterase